MEYILWTAVAVQNERGSFSESPLSAEWCESLITLLRKKAVKDSFKDWAKKHHATITSGYEPGYGDYGKIYKATATTYDGCTFKVLHLDLEQLLSRYPEFEKLDFTLPYSRVKLELCRILHKAIKAKFQKKNLSKATQEWMDKFK